MITLIIGSIAFFVAGFAAWYTLWHRRLESSFERVPVRTGRSVHVLRQDVDLPRDPR
ncbi:MAG TPA: hypothetical protein VHS57_05460 [Acidimicrobiales bacterium]|jgi:hypothetical protein|nr:hypothetical protein [Acidimicrobiales bacterium]